MKREINLNDDLHIGSISGSLTYSPAVHLHQSYGKIYENSLSHWPVKVDSSYVPTSFGQTHVIDCGPEEAEPLLLLHGAMCSSTMWYPNIVSFSQKYRTYAIDIIDDKNKSMLQKQLESREEYAYWLSEVMDGLGIRAAHMTGLSYGGQLIVNFAMHCPARILKCIVMSPAESFVSFRAEFYAHAFGLASDLNGVEKFHKWVLADRYQLPQYFVDQFQAGVFREDLLDSEKYRKRVWPYVWADEELKSLTTEMLLLFGEHEVMYNPHEAKERAVRLLPQVKTEILKNAGHILSIEQAALVNDKILQFLSE